MTDRASAISTKAVGELLRVMPSALRAELTALPSPALSWHPAPGEWCAMGNAQRFSLS